MPIQKKIFWINLLLAVFAVTGFAFATDTFPGNGFFLMVSFITLFLAVACLLTAFVLWLMKKGTDILKGFFASSLLFFILSAVSYFLLKQY